MLRKRNQGKDKNTKYSRMAGKGFYRSDLNEEFFASVAKSLGITLTSWDEEFMVEGVGIASELVKQRNSMQGIKALVGMFKFYVHGINEDGEVKCFPILIKVLSDDMDSGWLSMLGDEFDEETKRAAKIHLSQSNGFLGSYHKEVLAARLSLKDPVLARIRPEVYHTVLNAQEQKYAVAMEFIGKDDMLLGGNLEYKVSKSAN